LVEAKLGDVGRGAVVVLDGVQALLKVEGFALVTDFVAVKEGGRCKEDEEQPGDLIRSLCGYARREGRVLGALSSVVRASWECDRR
jgi:hypothetical protein